MHIALVLALRLRYAGLIESIAAVRKNAMRKSQLFITNA
jgi:hypothetical protein